MTALEYNMYLYQQQQNTLDLIVDLCGEVSNLMAYIDPCTETGKTFKSR